MAHTPGPYVVARDYQNPCSIEAVNGGGAALAKVYLTDPKTRKRTQEFRDNANLFATAPDMLPPSKPSSRLAAAPHPTSSRTNTRRRKTPSPRRRGAPMAEPRVPPIVAEEIARAGVPFRVESGGKHAKLFVCGRLAGIIPRHNPQTSDKRPALNLRAQVRKIIAATTIPERKR